MKSERRVSGVKSEVHRLVKKSFKRNDSGSSVNHNYDLRIHRMIQITKLLLSPTFPQSSGQSRTIKENSHQRRTSNCFYVTVV